MALLERIIIYSMDKVYNSENQGFFCTCQNIFVSKSQLIEHLKLPQKHNFIKKPRQSPPLESFKNSIFNKIEAINKIQVEVQQFSAQLIQTISHNTLLTVQKLDLLISVYKSLIQNPSVSEPSEIYNKHIVSIFEVNPSLNLVIKDQFEKKIIAEAWTIESRIKMTKRKVIEIYEKNCSLFSCMVISKDEKFIVTGGAEGAIRVWELKTQTQIGYFFKHKYLVSSLALGRDDNFLLSSGGDPILRLWDLKTKKLDYEFRGHTESIASVAFSNDGKIGISGSKDGYVSVWNLESRLIQSKIFLSNKIFKICLIDQDKTVVASGENGLVAFVNLSTMKSQELQKRSSMFITSLDFSTNYKYFVTGFIDGNIQVWLTFSNKFIFEAKEHKSKIGNCAFITETIFATCSADIILLIWDLERKSLIHSVALNDMIQCISFSKSSESLVLSVFTTIYYYTPKINKTEKKLDAISILPHLITVSIGLNYVAFSTKYINLFSIEKNRKLAELPHHSIECTCLKFSPDGNYLAVGYYSGEVLIRTAPSLTITHSFMLGSSNVNCLAFSENNRLIGCGYKYEKLLIVLIDQKEIIYNHSDIVASLPVFYSNDKKFIYSDFDGVVHIVDVDSRVVLKKIVMPLSILMVSDNCRIAVGYTSAGLWYCIDLVTYEIKLEMDNRELFKAWNANHDHFKFKVLLKLPFISIS